MITCCENMTDEELHSLPSIKRAMGMIIIYILTLGFPKNFAKNVGSHYFFDIPIVDMTIF